MSTQPVPINRQQQVDELKAKQKRAARRYDVLYWAGVVLVACGVGEIRFYLAPIAIGFFCLVIPSLELAAGFIRGLRAPNATRR
jgi:hypothetical protein